MRIAVNARFLLPGKLEGIGWYSYHVLNRLVHNYPQHEYYFIYDRPQTVPMIQHESIRHLVVAPPARHPFLWFIWFEWSLPRLFKKIAPDLFFSPDGYGCLQTSVPQFMVVHDLSYLHFPEQVPWLVNLYYRYFVPRHLNKAQHLFGVSNATKQDLCNSFPDCCQKISLAPNGVRSVFRPIEDVQKQTIKDQYAEGKDYFLFVGAIHPRKNLVNLIHAFGQLKKKTQHTIQLIIVGRKAWSNRDFENALERSPFQKEIHCYGYVESELLAQLTASAFAAIQPSFLEGFGVPVLEALYCDIPVLVSDAFSLPEVAGPGAYLFDPYSIESMTQQMELCLNDPFREDRLTAGRRHRIQFNWDDTAIAIAKRLGL